MDALTYQNRRTLPIGVQSFEKIRDNGCVYVDKTAYIYELLRTPAPYFLSRPRRFGKSLLVSTMKAYFEGRKDLFEGLAITELTKNDPDPFAEYPVFHFDFNGADYSTLKDLPDEDEARISSVLYGIDAEAIDAESNDIRDIIDRIQFRSREGSSLPILPLEQVLDEHLRNWEDIYGSDPRNRTLSSRFRYLIRTSVERTGRKAVVLVDEYDKALLEEKPGLDDLNRLAYKAFFGVLKSYDEYLKFVFITGVTKYSKVSIFSDLNQLIDISLDKWYANICGVTESEMKDNFAPEIEALAEAQDMTVDECLTELKRMYDGYHFYQNTEGLYNPFSLLNAFYKHEVDSKWFESGTPTFLIKKLEKTGFDPKRITEGNLEESRDGLSDYKSDDDNPVPLLFQTGYLTIRDYDKEFRSYKLGYPNDEVRYGFLKSLIPMIFHRLEDSSINPLDVREFVNDIRCGDTVGVRERFTALYASLPYPSCEPDKLDQYVERDFQNVVYITFMLLGQYVKAEVHNAVGRADVIVETTDYVWIFEFKRDKSAKEALAQIDEKSYDLPHAADRRTILKIGVNFSSETRNIDGWIVG